MVTNDIIVLPYYNQYGKTLNMATFCPQCRSQLKVHLCTITQIIQTQNSYKIVVYKYNSSEKYSLVLGTFQSYPREQLIAPFRQPQLYPKFPSTPLLIPPNSLSLYDTHCYYMLNGPYQYNNTDGNMDTSIGPLMYLWDSDWRQWVSSFLQQ